MLMRILPYIVTFICVAVLVIVMRLTDDLSATGAGSGRAERDDLRGIRPGLGIRRDTHLHLRHEPKEEDGIACRALLPLRETTGGSPKREGTA